MLRSHGMRTGGALFLTNEKRYREMVTTEERMPSDSTVILLETLERHGYMKIAELIDGSHLDEADKVADILKKVGIC